MSGTLYLVSTPIGNLGDMTARALEVLAQADFVIAEDTRVARRLLTHFGITKPLVSYYEHNMRERGAQILERLSAGENAALTTDAGTPAISDPGSMLVAQCREAGVTVTAVPGACAAVAAFSLAGLMGGRFCFEGFLTVNKKGRRAHLESLRCETRAMIFYEAPHKLRATLADLCAVFGPARGLLAARELTKLHEECLRTTLGGAVEKWADEAPRGEFVLVVDGADAPEAPDPEDAQAHALERARALVEEGLRLRDAAAQAAAETGVPKNTLYRSLLEKTPAEGG